MLRNRITCGAVLVTCVLIDECLQYAEDVLDKGVGRGARQELSLLSALLNIKSQVSGRASRTCCCRSCREGLLARLDTAAKCAVSVI